MWTEHTALCAGNLLHPLTLLQRKQAVAHWRRVLQGRLRATRKHGRTPYFSRWDTSGVFAAHACKVKDTFLSFLALASTFHHFVSK